MIIFRILMLIPFVGVLIATYAVMVFMGVGAEAGIADWLTTNAYQVMQVQTAGDAGLWLTNGDMFVLLGLLALALEMIKSTNTKGWSLGNHGLSMLVFIVAMGLLLVTSGYATATFLLLTAMALVDVLVGMLVTIVTARRDIGLGGFAAG